MGLDPTRDWQNACKNSEGDRRVYKKDTQDVGIIPIKLPHLPTTVMLAKKYIGLVHGKNSRSWIGKEPVLGLLCEHYYKDFYISAPSPDN